MKKILILGITPLLFACASTQEVCTLQDDIDSLKVHVNEADSVRIGVDMHLYQLIMQLNQNQQFLIKEIEKMRI